MLTVGDKFPALTVPVQQGGALPAGETINLGETNGKWKILFYWPKDFTFVCPTEIIGYGELAKDFKDRDAELIGASTDTDFVHHAWRKADERLAAADFPWIADNKKELANARKQHPDLKTLPYPMLADTKRELSTALGILHKEDGVPLRAAFIVDPQGVIRFASVNDLSVGRNVDEVLRVLDALQTDELCPCNWHEGEEVLRPAA